MGRRVSSAGCAGGSCRAAGPRSRPDARSSTRASSRSPSQPAFAESFRERRCLIPADGFYEWRKRRARQAPGLDQRARRRAVRVRRDLGGDSARPPATRRDAPQLRDRHHARRTSSSRPIHDRMPVILAPGCGGRLARSRPRRGRRSSSSPGRSTRHARGPRGKRSRQRRPKRRRTADRAARGRSQLFSSPTLSGRPGRLDVLSPGRRVLVDRRVLLGRAADLRTVLRRVSS